MSVFTRECPKCRGTMEQGFTLDKDDLSSAASNSQRFITPEESCPCATLTTTWISPSRLRRNKEL